MRQASTEFEIATRGQGLYALTGQIVSWVASAGIVTGLLTLHVRHTSASLLIQENADPDVLDDMERFFRKLVPEGERLYKHAAEGSDDMPSHIRAALTATTLSIPVASTAPALGTWQGIFLYEHRHAPHRRRIAAHIIGE